MKTRTTYVGVPAHIQPMVDWVLRLIESNHDAKITEASLTIGLEADTEILLSKQFYQDLAAGIYLHDHHMPRGPFIELPCGEIDYLSSIFYLVNCIQEYDCKDLDKYGRFKYDNSLQKKWSVTTKNLVWEYIQAFCDKHNISYRKLPVNACYLSHDIDFIYRGWKREGLKAAQQGSLGKAADIVSSRFLGRPIFANVDEIANLEALAGHNSTFYWIASQENGVNGIINADYDMNDPLVLQMMSSAEDRGCEHGMHKSAAKSSLQEEAAHFDGKLLSNRYHYLKFTLPQAWAELEAAGIDVDCSLGFAEHYGYRNSYGLPFRPYDLTTGRTLDLLVVPLHIMDATLTDYMSIPEQEVASTMLEWIQAVREHTLIGVLWHNTNLSEKVSHEMRAAYVSLLDYMQKHDFESKTPTSLLEDCRK